MISFKILIIIFDYIDVAGKPFGISDVKIIMTETNHVKYIWQLLVLRQRMDVDPYGLTQAELQTLQSYEIEGRQVTTSQ